LFGAFSPINGDSFLLEMPHCNTATFQIFLNHFSIRHPNEYKIIVLDNGAFHKAKQLIVPHNMALLFLPPYAPELNPAEKIWAHLKRQFTNQLFKTLDQLSNFIIKEVQDLSTKVVLSTCAYSYIFSGINWTI
jgi:transposase